MCGIAGLVARNIEYIKKMAEQLHHRGPDNIGITYCEPDNSIALAHTRLSIIDLDSRSNQPMVSSCGRFYLTYNGEIYNYKELKVDLQEKGYKFNTTSDTEVLLNLYIEYGSSCLNMLDGMFAFCFYDKELRSMFLARDPLGEKPLYYAIGSENQFAFSSEFFPLSKIEWVDKRLSLEALKNFLLFMYVPAPQTLMNGIKDLMPGHYLEIKLTNFEHKICKYYDLEDKINNLSFESYERSIDQIRDIFDTGIKMRLRSDLPVGVYLSGGLDSNVISATAVDKTNSSMDSYTMSYKSDSEANEYDESEIARNCAEFYSISNEVVELNVERDYFTELEENVEIFGLPFGNSTSYVAEKLAATVVKKTKVCLVGDGGDEIFLGYPRHRAVLLHGYINRLPRVLIIAFLKILFFIPETGKLATRVRRLRQFLEAAKVEVSEAYLRWNNYCENEEINKLLNCQGKTDFQKGLLDIFQRHKSDPLLASSLFDLKSFVPYNLMQCADRTSMHNSLELRCPFLSKELIEAVLNVPSTYKLHKKTNKPLLVDTFRKRLPEFILQQKKKPFNPPMRTYMFENINKIKGILLSEKSLLQQLLSVEFLNREIDAFHGGKVDNTKLLWGLSTLEIWLRLHYKDKSTLNSNLVH